MDINLLSIINLDDFDLRENERLTKYHIVYLVYSSLNLKVKVAKLLFMYINKTFLFLCWYLK